MPRSKKINLKNELDCNKEILFDLMNLAGLEKLIIYFDGGGDDGQINDCQGEPNTFKIIDKFFKDKVEGARIVERTIWQNGNKSLVYKDDPTVKDLVYNICYDILESQFGGWENDDGCCGDFIIDAYQRKVELTMRERYYEYQVSQYHF